MTVPTQKTAFASGELSPKLWGRVDLSKWHLGCSVARNFVVSYTGGLFSRGGTALVGICKQPASASSTPPRNIEFTFSISQSYILEFGDQYMRVIANGGYVTETPKTISGASEANPCVITCASHGFSNGDWIFIDNIVGMTQLNGRTFIAADVTTNTFALNDAFGDAIDASAYGLYVSGGTAARLYTLTTPYAAQDLPYLKYAQSADVMSLTCVNPVTLKDYAPQELTRVSANNWTIGPPTFASSISAPATCTATPSASYSSGAGPAAYGYVVTAVGSDGQESVASPIGTATNSVDIASQYGTVTVTWAPVTGAASYNIYKATPDYTNTGTFAGQLFGYAGSSNTTGWHDTNIIPDFTTTPPLHSDPFSITGDYPSVVAYFQQRRFYANTINNPDTYWGSKPGAYTNFDAADPPIDSDSIIGSPWASQVNGIQWLMPMPGGCIVGTGKDAWQLSGTGGAASPITPSQQSAQQQESIGFSTILPPIKINYSILYGQSLGSIIRELNYNFYFNIYAGNDVTLLSSHLFQGFNMLQWAWAQEPYKVVWVLRDDGKALSFTYLKEEEVRGWARHDTNGLFVSVATASEPPVNAVYWIVKRYVPAKSQWVYIQERMDNRIWPNVESAWCVDSGLDLEQPTPSATLTANISAPSNGCLAGTVITGGANYSSAASATIVDDAGTGSGAVVGTVVVAGGVIQSYTILNEGSGYGSPRIEFTDTTGSGASAEVLIDRNVTFNTDAAVFSSSDVGSVIRAGGGIATVTQYVSGEQVIASFTTPIAQVIPNDPNNTPVPFASGSWTMTKPVIGVTGLDHLDGFTVTGLADGRVIPPTTVINGSVTLTQAASSIVIGLPFTAQAQSMHADIQGTNIQGKRKRIQAVITRLVNSRGVKIGQDQPIASAQPNQADLPWNASPNFMTEVDEPTSYVNAGNATPLFTGDKYTVVAGDYQTIDGQPSPGMVAVMQDNPLPAEVAAFVPLLELGDVPN